MTILKEARRPTTRACHTDKCKRFVCYCHTKQINPFSATVQNMVAYLLNLQLSGLAFTSIRLHLATVAAYLLKRQHLSLFKIPVIKTFMEGLKRVIPLRVPPAPSWNLNIVPTRLMGAPFEPPYTCPPPNSFLAGGISNCHYITLTCY